MPRASRIVIAVQIRSVTSTAMHVRISVFDVASHTASKRRGVTTILAVVETVVCDDGKSTVHFCFW